MEAIRETVDVVGNTVTVRLPAGFLARRVEVIVLPVQDQARQPAQPRRQPAPELAGTVIHDDLIDPAAGADDWDALR